MYRCTGRRRRRNRSAATCCIAPDLTANKHQELIKMRPPDSRLESVRRCRSSSQMVSRRQGGRGASRKPRAKLRMRRGVILMLLLVFALTTNESHQEPAADKALDQSTTSQQTHGEGEGGASREVESSQTWWSSNSKKMQHLSLSGAPTAASSLNQQKRHQQEDTQQQEQRPREAPAKRRQSRVYRIRAAGANGSFAAHAALHRHHEPSPRDQRKQAQDSLSNRTLEAAESQEFGVRQQQSAAAKLQSQDATKQKASCEGGETSAETSSISASSPTLRLTTRPRTSGSQGEQGSGQQLVLGPPVQSRGRGEVDESLSPAAVAASPQLQRDQMAASEQPDVHRESLGGDSNEQQASQLADQKSAESILSLIDEFDSKITTNRTQAQLSCDSGEMIVRLNFTEPFKGFVYPDHNRLSPCRFFGDGHHNYELRLPLRGCGTRQVAPRVFVNDVIVRFHKTLELEEDEVKTLICRYPPPLDAALHGGLGLGSSSNGLQLAAGNGIVHELGGGSSSRPTGGGGGGGSKLAGDFSLLPASPNEFELAASGRPTSRYGSASPSPSQLEILGELLAPSGGHQRHQDANSTPADRILMRQQQHDSNTRQHDNLLLAPGGPLTPSGSGGKQQQQSDNLVGPVDGLGGSNLQGVAASQPAAANFLERLSSIELLFLISSLMFLVLLALGLAGSYYCFSRRRNRRGDLGLPGAGPHLLRPKRYFNSPASLLTGPSLRDGLATAGTATRYQRAHLMPAQQPHYQTPSVNRTLYSQSSGRRPDAYYQPHYLQQQEQQQQQPVGGLNGPPPPSSPDDSDISGQNLLPASNRRPHGNQQHGRFSQLAPSAHYQAATLRPVRSAQKGTVLGRRSQQQQDPAAGNYGRRVSPEWHQRPMGAQQSFAHPNLRSSATNFQPFQQQQQKPSVMQLPVGSSTLGRRPAREPLLRLAAPNSTHHTTNSMQRPVRALPASQAIAANQYYAQVRHARWLQQLRERDQEELTVEGQKGGGQLNNERIRAKLQQHYFDSSTLARPSTGSPSQRGLKHQRSKSEFRVVDLSSSGSSSASDSELETDRRQDRPPQGVEPKLILTSIEDSFVTNLTEVYEQEYKKYDTRRPLSMAEWRARQPGRRAKDATSSDSDSNSNSGSESEDNEHEQGRHSNQTNLRSLTEVDVDFAKTLLRPSLEQQSGDRLAQAEDEQKDEQVRAAATQSKEAAATPTPRPTPTPTPTPTQPKTISTTTDQQADLVISPEYNVAGLSRLQLRPSGGEHRSARAQASKSPGAQSHESISYV